MHDVNKCGGTLNTPCWVSTKSGQEKHQHDRVCRLDCWRKHAVSIVPASFKHVCRARTRWSCTCLHLFFSTFPLLWSYWSLSSSDTSQMWPRTSTFFQAAYPWTAADLYQSYQPARSCIDTTNYGPCQSGSMDDLVLDYPLERSRPRSMTKIDLQT